MCDIVCMGHLDVSTFLRAYKCIDDDQEGGKPTLPYLNIRYIVAC